jgi:hypothetical protein
VIRPTARLNFKIRKEELSDELASDIMRCYLNVAPVDIEGIEDTEEQPAVDTLELVVVLHHPYWREGGEADETWNAILLPWLEKKLWKVGATVMNYNKTRAVTGQPLYFKALDLSMKELTFSIGLPDDASFPDEIPSLIDRCRVLVNTGVLEGLELVRVDMPWRDPNRFREFPTSDMDDVSHPSGSEGDADEERSSGDAVPAVMATPATGSEENGDPVSSAPIDYTVWEVHLADGSSRKLDTNAGTWID